MTIIKKDILNLSYDKLFNDFNPGKERVKFFDALEGIRNFKDSNITLKLKKKYEITLIISKDEILKKYNYDINNSCVEFRYTDVCLIGYKNK